MKINTEGFISENGTHWEVCECGRMFNSDEFNSCFECHMEKKGFVKCQRCNKAWHDPKYPFCFKCAKGGK